MMTAVEDVHANHNLPSTLLERIRCQNGGEKLDLCLCGIKWIPLQAIQENFEGPPSQLDLSYNMIRFVSPKFTLDMIHLTKLDLSSNQIKMLPDNFGALQELVYLDLHKNQLETLPISMGKMHRLSFLRISENPFRPPLKDFLGQTDPGISAVALAGLVVQFLDEFASVHTPETQSRRSISQDSKRSKIHYRGRNKRAGPDGDSSASSLTSGAGEPCDTYMDIKEDTGATNFYQTLKWIGFMVLWAIITPLVIAYFVDASYFEHIVKNKATLGSFWSKYKLVHEKAASLTSWIPKNSRFFLKGPPPASLFKAIEDITWGRSILNAIIWVKDAYINTAWKVGVWLRILNP